MPSKQGMLQIMKKKIFFAFCCCMSLYIALEKDDERSKILLISLDGFRWDFQAKGKTPNLEWMVKNGVSAKYMVNVFPTMTLPNHQSIVTGKYPGNHGIIGNEMYDKKNKRLFNMYSEKTWNKSTPIWIENEIQGHESGVCYWPGHNVYFKGKKATYTANDSFTDPYTSPPKHEIMPLDDRINLIIDWISKPKVTFVAFYYEEPDETAHITGTEEWKEDVKKELNKTISSADQLLGKIFKKLNVSNLRNVNVIVVGDHGHTTVKYDRAVYLDKVIDLEKNIEYIIGTTCVFIFTKKDRREHTFKKLKTAEEHFKVYLKENIPLELNLRNSDRAPDILIIGNPGWAILQSRKRKEWFEKGTEYWKIGDHGYHTDERSMNTIFYGHGPAFKKDYRVNSTRLIDLYSLMCDIIGIKPSENDGDLGRVRQFIKVKESVKDKKGILRSVK